MTMPWETEPARTELLEIPPALKRDANNRAPFMDAPNPSASLPTFDPASLPPWVSKS